MVSIQVISRELEKKLSQGLQVEELRDELAALTVALSAALAEIEYILPKQSTTECRQIELVQVSKMLADLKVFLKNDDIKAINLWRDIAPLLSEAIGDDNCLLLGHQIEGFDLSVALVSLYALIEKHPVLGQPIPIPSPSPSRST